MSQDNKPEDNKSELNVPVEDLPDDYFDFTIPFDSPCRNSTNLVSFYLTELNGLGLIMKIIILMICLRNIKKLKNKLVLVLLVILFIHSLLHAVIILTSFTPFCDSANFDWKPGNIFNIERCHMKHEIYYSQPFWIIDTITPLLLLIVVLYKSKLV
jgi:hypothetical protein